MANTIVVHGCGGAGINITNDVFTKLETLGDGFATIKYHYLDTSTANIDKIQPRGEFWRITTKTNSKTEITGSGGERITHAKDIMANIEEYLDKNNYIKRDPNQFHMVVFSASGGTGNVCGVGLIRSLITKSIPTIAIVIGDSTNGLNTKNTINTIASLDMVARGCKKPLSIIYFNNHHLAEGKTLQEAEEDTNKLLTNVLTTISLFLSGDNTALDNQDMYGIIDQSHYTTIGIEPGLYSLTVHSKEIKLANGAIPTVGRTLTLENHDFDTNLTLLHHKRGYVTNSNAISIVKEENFPLHLIASANYLTNEEQSLRKIEEDYNNILANIKNNSISGSTSSNLDDSVGLVF